MVDIQGKVALVTGASRGIGRAVVLMLAQSGCHVSFNYLKSVAEATALAQEAQSHGVKCKAVCADIKDFNAVKKWVEDTKKEFGQIDILINNAGILNDKALMMMAPEDWQEGMDTNLTGMFNATRALIVGFLK